MNLFELFVKIGVDDQASGNLKSIGQKLGNGLKTAAKVGAAAVGTAAAAITALTAKAVNSFAEYEQLAGGAQKIFDQMDYSKIATDANNAYKELGLSANQYLAVINDVGATFAATMGDEAGYEAAKTGLKAIADYASGTGKNVDELSQKFTLITRSTSSYQSIADQFSGILPATSDAFLEQAQAAGILSDSYTQLTEVPIDEYQSAVSQMLQQGVSDLGLANNAANEAMTTISGSLSATKSSWSNLITAIGGGGDVKSAMNNLVESAGAVFNNIIPVAEEALGNIGSVITELAPVITSALPGLIKRVLPSLVSAAVELVKSLSASLPSILSALIDAIVEAAPLLIDGIVVAFESIVEMLPELIQQIADALPVLVPPIIAGIAQMVVILVENLPAILASLFSAFISLFSGIWEGIKEVFKLEKVKEFFKSVWTGITDAFGSVATWFGDIFDDAWEAVEDAFDSVGDFFSGLWDDITGIFSEIGSTIGEAVSDAFSTAINWVLDVAITTINGFISAINAIISVINAIPGVEIEKIKKLEVPQLAKGGIVSEPTLALIGERGKEVVLPLDDNNWVRNIASEMNRQLGNTSNEKRRESIIETINININGIDFDNPERIADIIAEKLNEAILQQEAVYA